MLALYLDSDRIGEPTIIIITLLFLTHYLQRTFIFPLLIRGKNKMPLTIIALGMTFNFTNAYMQGYWLYHLSPKEMYTVEWLTTPQFIIGTIIFIIGMVINLHSDYIIPCLLYTSRCV